MCKTSRHPAVRAVHAGQFFKLTRRQSQLEMRSKSSWVRLQPARHCEDSDHACGKQAHQQSNTWCRPFIIWQRRHCHSVPKFHNLNHQQQRYLGICVFEQVQPSTITGHTSAARLFVPVLVVAIQNVARRKAGCAENRSRQVLTSSGERACVAREN